MMLDKLRDMLRTATNSVLVGFTATPLMDDGSGTLTAEKLLDVIKGESAVRSKLSNEGFTSYFMGAPSPVFPAVKPSRVPQEVPQAIVREVVLANFSAEMCADAKPKPKAKVQGFGNLAEYQKTTIRDGGKAETAGAGDGTGDDQASGGETLVKPGSSKKAHGKAKAGNASSHDELGKCVKVGAAKTKGGKLDAKLWRCAMANHINKAGTLRTFKTLAGEQDSLLTVPLPEDTPDDLGYCRDRVNGYCSKLSAVCDDVDASQHKWLVLVHSMHGFKLIARLLDRRFPGQVCAHVGGPPGRTKNWDDECVPLSFKYSAVWTPSM